MPEHVGGHGSACGSLGTFIFDTASSLIDVDAEVLPELTVEDLIGLGATFLRQRGVSVPDQIGLAPPHAPRRPCIIQLRQFAVPIALRVRS
jgi:hypothetical protein